MECASCGAERPAAASLERQRGERRGGSWRGSGPLESEPLCQVCLDWLLAVVDAAQGAPGNSPLIGSPGAAGLTRVYDDQCVICRARTRDSADLLRLAGPKERGHTGAVLACTPCAAWVTGLATDGRSARGGVSRSIDGPYGDWLHPNLRTLSASVAVRDELAHWAITETLRAMEVAVVAAGVTEAVHFVEAGLAHNPVHQESPRILMAPLQAGAILRRELQRGAAAWLTLPVTPQRITAALMHVLRGDTPQAWNGELGLAEVEVLPTGQRGLAVDLAPGVAPFEVCWLLKRFARGYDEVVSVQGAVVVVPRVPPAQLSRVAERLEHLLNGRATLRALAPSRLPEHRILDLAG